MSLNESAVQSDYEYWYDNVEPSKPTEGVILPCDLTIDERLYHISMAVISLIVMLILAAVTRQKRLHQGLRKDVLGLLSPVSFLEHSRHKGLAVAVFGLLFCKLCMVVLSHNPLPFTKNQEYREYWKILALFYYPALYYPLLACGSLHSQPGYALGSLLSWAHFGVLVWQKVDCPRTPEIYAYYSLLTSLPQIASLAFLSILYPRLLLEGLKSGRGIHVSEDLESSFYKDYVKDVLRKKPPQNSLLQNVQQIYETLLLALALRGNVCSAAKPKLSERIFDAVKSCIYTPEEVFQFPLKLTISAAVSFIAVYQVALLLVSAVVPTLQKVRAGVNEDIAFLLAGFNIILSQDRAEVVQIVIHYMWCVEVCYLSAVTLSCLVTLLMLMQSMIQHRSNLRSLYRGGVYSRQSNVCPSRQALVYWMGFTGYQAALVCLGMMIQTLVFLICFLFAVFLVIVPILYKRNLVFFRILGNIWPFWSTLLLVVILQHAASRFAFIKKDAGTRDLDNRSGLFLMTYLLFPLNTLVGVLLGSWRVTITALFNVVHLCRMDISLLSRGAEAFDPGYRCYSQYLKIEVSQGHPVMKAFCSILLQSVTKKGIPGLKLCDTEEGVRLVQKEMRRSSKSRARRAQARWLLLFTLINNPSVVASRKHFQSPQNSEGLLNGKLNSKTREGRADGANKEANASITI